MLSVQIRQLRAALRNFKTAGQVKTLIEEVRKLRGMVTEAEAIPYSDERKPIRRGDLRLVCFEFLSGG